MQNESLVSVICPVYNTNPVFLRDCITSVLEQTYRSFELIIVDDNSQKKETLEVLNSYARSVQNDKIKVIHNQDNKGISESRNIGIDNSQGKFITFIDHDDMYERKFLEIMVKAVEEQNCDYVCCEHYVLTGGKKNKILNSISGDMLKAYQNELVWQHIYLRDFIIKNNIRFPNGKYCEDVVFSQLCNLCTCKCKNIEYYGYINRTHALNTSRTWDFYKQWNTKLPKEQIEYIAVWCNAAFVDNNRAGLNELQWTSYIALPVCFWIDCCKNNKREKKQLAKWLTRIVCEDYGDINCNRYYRRWGEARGSCTYMVWCMSHLMYFAVVHQCVYFMTKMLTDMIVFFLNIRNLINRHRY